MTKRFKTTAAVCSFTNHNGEDDGQEGGLQDPENSQTCDLDQREEVHLPQGDVTEVGEVGLVFGWHHVQLNPVPELGGRSIKFSIRSTCDCKDQPRPPMWTLPISSAYL